MFIGEVGDRVAAISFIGLMLAGIFHGVPSDGIGWNIVLFMSFFPAIVIGLVVSIAVDMPSRSNSGGSMDQAVSDVYRDRRSYQYGSMV